MGLNKTPVWRGAKKLIEDEDSPEIVEDDQGLKVTQNYTGPYSDCLARRPKAGAMLAGFDEVRVKVVRVKRAPGGQGKLTVESTANKQNNDEGGGGGSEAGNPKYEVDWVREDKPLASNSYFASVTKDQFKEIQAALQEGRDPNIPTPFADAWKYYELRLKGQDSYMVFGHVVRKTTPYAGPPATSGAGKRSTPPFSQPGLIYLKTADRAVQQNGGWSRVEEWIGTDGWDEDIYPAE